MCTNLTIQRKSNNEPMISARTMDFGFVLPTKIQFVPRHQSFPEVPLPGEIQWKNKYGFIGTVHRISGETGYSDGLNEEGLSAASLWLQCSKYPSRKSAPPILCNHNIVSYVLGNFKNIDEVKAALSKVTIIDIGKPFKTPLHFIISDTYGNHLIVEFIGGKMKTYTNQIGVLTNDPPFDWHLTNLCNFKNLSLKNSPNHCGDIDLYGSGQFGSPGDPSSHSRFIRAELLSHSTFKPKDSQQSIGLALQILRTIAIPCGTVNFSSNKPEPDKPGFDWTLWGVIRDHTNRSYYFFSDFNSKLYGIHLKDLDLNGSKPKQIDIIQHKWYVDITNKLSSNT